MILVTGATGFVGRAVVARLVTSGAPVRALVRAPDRAAALWPGMRIELAQGDTTRPETLSDALQGVDTLIHSAFVVPNLATRAGASAYQTNIVGTRNVVAAARQAGTQRICVVSGLGARADAADTYQRERYEADEIVRQSGLAWSILQPSAIFGPHAPAFESLVAVIRRSPVVPLIGDGKRLFQPIWVEDVAHCIALMAYERPRDYDSAVIEVGGPEIYTYSQMLNLLMRATGARKPKAPIPLSVMRLSAGIMERTQKRPLVTRATVSFFSFDNSTTPDAVERHFAFTPLSFEAYLAQGATECATE